MSCRKRPEEGAARSGLAPSESCFISRGKVDCAGLEAPPSRQNAMNCDHEFEEKYGDERSCADLETMAHREIQLSADNHARVYCQIYFPTASSAQNEHRA